MCILRRYWFVPVIASLMLFADQVKAQHFHDDIGHNYTLTSSIMQLPDPQFFLTFAYLDVSSYIVHNRTTRGWYIMEMLEYSQPFKILCLENDIYWGWTMEGNIPVDGATAAVAFNNGNTDEAHIYYGAHRLSANFLKPAGQRRSATPCPSLWQGRISTPLMSNASHDAASVLFSLHDGWGISYYATDVATDPTYNVQYFMMYPSYAGAISKGLIIFDPAYGALKITVFENDHFGSYTLEGHWTGEGSSMSAATSAGYVYTTSLYSGPATLAGTAAANDIKPFIIKSH